MKNKVIYLFLVIFLASLISSAKKIQGTCNSICTKTETEKCKQAPKDKATKQSEYHTPSLNLFFFNI